MKEKDKKINLILYDMENFITKYTRFLSKDTYITYNAYQTFISQYQYFFQQLKQVSILYQTNPNYQKILKILTEEKELLKRHNIKFLKKHQEKLKEITNDELNTNMKNIIISNENKLIFFNQKNNLLFIVQKIKYLIEKDKLLPQKIIILVQTKEEKKTLQENLAQNNLSPISCYTLEESQEKQLNKNERRMTYKIKYSFFKNYICNELFQKKDVFSKLHQAFKNYLYLSKDYQEFETFKDYHAYIYKRMYLDTKLPLKKFLEKEILKRKKKMRTIQNEEINSKIEIDIANFLYLNKIEYTYSAKRKTFTLKNNLSITYHEETFDDLKIVSNFDHHIHLYQKYLSKKTPLSVLTYELIKRRYPMEKRENEAIYTTLKETSNNSYITEFITKVLIPMTEKETPLEEEDLSQEQYLQLKNINQYYQKYKEENHLIETFELNHRIEEKLNSTYYSIFLNIDTIIPQKNYFIILENQKENTIIKENLKLQLDYQKYVQHQKWLLFPNTFLSLEEKDKLTKDFLKENVDRLNQIIEKRSCPIDVYFYEDKTTLQTRENLAQKLNSILTNLPSSKTAIILSKTDEINELTKNSLFSKSGKETITNDKDQYHCYLISNLEKKANTIILPLLIKSNNQENLFYHTNLHETKMILFSSITKCREKIILLSPISKKEETEKLLKTFQNTIDFK